MQSVGCGGVAGVSSVAAANSFPDLKFSSPRPGPWQGSLCSSRRQAVLSDQVIFCPLPCEPPDVSLLLPARLTAPTLLVLPDGS